MEDKVLITFQSKNAKKVQSDLKGIARLANAASVAVNTMNKTVASGGGSVMGKQLTTSSRAATAAVNSQTKAVTKGDKAYKQYHKTQGALRGQNEGMARSFSSMRNALLLYAFATAAVVRSLKDLVKVHLAWEASMLRTTQLLKITAGASGHTADELRDMATAMGDLTLESAQGVLDASNALLTFKSVSGDVFDRALESASDLAALGFGSMQSAAVQLGKALEDPAIGLASLKRVGVTFSKGQQKSIKLLVKQNQLYTAQKVILSALESQTKGTAKAAAEGLAGALDSASEASANLKKQMGENGVGEIIAGVADGFTTLINALMEFDRQTNIVSGVVVTALAGITVGLGAVIALLGKHLGAVLLQVAAKAGIANAALTSMGSALGLSMSATLGVIGLVILAIGTLAAGAAKQKALELKRKKAIDASVLSVKNLAEAIRDANKEIAEANTFLGKEVITSSRIDQFTQALGKDTADLKRKVKEQKALWAELVAAREKQVGSLVTAALRVSGLDYYVDDKGARGLASAINVLSTEINTLTTNTGASRKALKDLKKTLEEVSSSAHFESVGLSFVKEDKDRENMRTDIKIVQGMIKYLQALEEKTGGVTAAFKELVALDIDPQSIIDFAKMGVSVEDLVKRLKKLKTEANVASASMQKLMAGADTFGVNLPEDTSLTNAQMPAMSKEALAAERERIDLRRQAMEGALASGDLMALRQIEIADREQELNLIREQGLVTMSEGVILQAELNEEMLKTQESSNVGDEMFRGLKLGVAGIMQETQSLGEIVATTVGDVFDGVGTAMDQMIKTGKVDWKSLASSIFGDLAKMLMKKALVTAVGGIFGEASSVATPAAGLAGGGTFSQGAPTLVGERGPELMVPSTSGRIVNNTQMNERGLSDGQASQPSIRIVNAVDGDAVLESASSSTIDRIVMNSINNNSTALRGVLA